MKSVTYEDAGVDIRAGDELVDFLRARNPAIGGFSGLFPLRIKGMKKPTLVASTDGVGTKLLIARQAGSLNSIGIDLVAMVVNDLITCGATPLFFLDYYATGHLKLREAKAVMAGILKGCELAGCPLIGGETAEMPSLYQPGDFDIAGFGIGMVDGAAVINGRAIRPGDLVFGFASSGLHSNGYSLVRRVLLEQAGIDLSSRVRELGCTLKTELLRPTRIYANLVDRIRRSGIQIKAYAHITGGGIPGNLCRVLSSRADAVVFKNRWNTPPIFKLIQRTGPVDYEEMLKTFNLGIGLMAVAADSQYENLMRIARAGGEKVWVVGKIVKGSGKVRVEVE